MSKYLINDSMVLMVGRGIALLISVITPMILVRIFSVGEYGEYRQAMLIVTTAAMFLPLGCPNSLYYFFPHFPEAKGKYLTRTIAVTMLTGGLFCLFMWLRAEDISRFFNNTDYLETAVLVGVLAFMLAASSLIDTVLLADSRVILSTKVMIIAKIIQVPVLIACAFHGGVILLLKGYLFVLLGKFFLSLWFFRVRYRISLFDLVENNWLPHLKYAIPLGFGVVWTMLAETLDKFLVSHYLGEEMFAIYSTGCYELPVIVVIFSSIGDVVLPLISQRKSMNMTSEVVRLWHRAIEQSMLIGIPIFIFFFAYANEFITTVFTVKYIDAVPIFRVSIIAILLESTRYGLITRAYARTGFMFFVSLIALVLMVPATYFGIKYIGMMGAIGAFVLTRCLIVGAEIAYSKFILFLLWRNLLPFRYMAKITILSFACLLLPMFSKKIFVLSNEWAQLFYLLAFSFLSFMYLTNYFGYWSPDILPIPDKFKKFSLSIFPGKRNNSWLSA